MIIDDLIKDAQEAQEKSRKAGHLGSRSVRIKTANARLRTAETGSRTEFHSTALETSLMSDPVEADPGLVRSDWVTLDTETSLKLAHQICGEGDVAVGNLLDLKSLNDVVVLGRPSD